MPPAYEETQYADITEFRKGDATLPKEGNSQSQGVEMQPQGAPAANGSSQDNEVKPQDANEDESDMRPKESRL